MAVIRNSPAKILELKDTSLKLGLSYDIQVWSQEDVQKWILWGLREFYSGSLDQLEIEGQELIAMDLAEFRKRVPDLSVFFYNELQIWKKINEDDKGKDSDDPLTDQILPAYVENYLDSPEVNQEDVDMVHEESIVSQPTSPNKSGSPNISTSDDASQNSHLPIDSQEIAVSQECCNMEEKPVTPPIITVTSLSPKATDQEPKINNENSPVKLETIPSPTSEQNLSVKNQKSPRRKSPHSSNPFVPQNSFLNRCVSSTGPQTSPSPMHSLSSLKMPSLQQIQNTPVSQCTPASVGMNPFLFQPGSLTPDQLALISPHLMGTRPRMFMTPSPQITPGYPFPFSGLFPQSPFLSPLLTPDLKSPNFNALPTMETVKENLKRLEKERQKHALCLEKGSEKLKKRRMKKKKLNDGVYGSNDNSVCSNSNSTIQTPDVSFNSPSFANNSENHSRGVKYTSNAANISDQKHLNSDLGHNYVDKNSNVKINSPCFDGTNPNIIETLLKLPPDLREKLSRQLSFPTDNRRLKPEIKVEPVNLAQSPVTVCKNSYDIPYYHATSLSYEQQNNENRSSPQVKENKLKQPDPMNLSIPKQITDDYSAAVVANADYNQNNTYKIESSDEETTSIKETYSPISSPSDTEVDGEKSYSNIPCPIFNLSSPEYPYRDNIPQTSSMGNNPEIVGLQIEPKQQGPRKRGRPPGTKPLARPLVPTDIQNSVFRSNHLWKFLLEMLEQPSQFGHYITWLDRPKGVFKIVNSATVASLWGKRKNNGKMTYDKFSRSIRQYYKKGIIVKTQPSKLIYKFGAEFFNPNGQ